MARTSTTALLFLSLIVVGKSSLMNSRAGEAPCDTPELKPPIFRLEKLGETVRVKAGAKTSFKPGMYDRAYDNTLQNVRFCEEGGSPVSHVISGRVISANTFAPAERILIFRGRNDGESPKLAAMTDARGNFRFTLESNPAEAGKHPDFQDVFSGHLYIGGKPKLNAKAEICLAAGRSRRYSLPDLRTFVRQHEANNSSVSEPSKEMHRSDE